MLNRKILHVAMVSGGKDSSCMVIKMLELGMPIDIILFCDTGKEFPQMYEHIKKLEKYIGREITTIQADNNFNYYMFNHLKRNGVKGYAWPDFKNRWCTQLLKKSVTHNYLKQYKDYDIIEYHGIAYDEQQRIHRNREKFIRYPLVNWKLTEKECLQFCYDRGFDWGGLYKKFNRVSCWCCPLQSLNDLKHLYNDYPNMWKQLKAMDKLSRNQFRLDYTFDQLEKKFDKILEIENNQVNMFDMIGVN